MNPSRISLFNAGQEDPLSITDPSIASRTSGVAASDTIISNRNTTNSSNIDQLIVFGDSLSSIGTGEPATPPSFGNRASNGPLLVDRLAEELRLPPLVPEQTNFALGGATSANLPDQLSLYNETNNLSPSDDLFFIWMGGNDILDSRRSANRIVDNIAQHVTALAAQGAKRFAIANLPPLGVAPLADSGAVAPLNQASAAFNQELAQRIPTLESSLGVKIYPIDIAQATSMVLQNPGQFGFTDQTTAFSEMPSATGSNNVSNNANRFVFWDPLHPTTAAHQTFYNLAVANTLGIPNRIQGTSDDDALRGTKTADLLEGNSGNDRLVGRGGNDELRGGSNNDTLLGNRGQDQLFGQGGADRLRGGGGDDLLIGGSGRDRLVGNRGDDSLTGGVGADRLTGGAGSDLFVYNSLRDRGDTITDFTRNDILDLRNIFRASQLPAGTNFDNLIELRPVNGNTEVRVDLDGFNQGTAAVTLVTLRNVSLSQINVLTR